MNNETLLRKWRLILGGSNKPDGGEGTGVELDGRDAKVDKALSMLYGDADGERSSERRGGLEESSPNVNRWLGDIREFFPASVVKVMQQDALKRLNLQSMLLQKEMLENVEPDVNLVSTLMTLSKVIPETTKETARLVIRKVVEEITRRIEQRTHQAINGSINRSSRIRNPKFKEINWHSTILKNLKHYQPDYKTIIPELRIGYGKKRRSLKDVVLCLDQSGSMGSSIVYSGIFGAFMASIPAIKTRMIVFDTAVADLSEELHDPVELLFGVQLGGGTDIDRALTYCQQTITRPNDTILVLITDLYEGGNQEEMRKRMVQLVVSGVQLVVLLALNDDGAPYYDHGNAAFLAAIGVPVFACTPDKFPDLMAAAINKQDIGMWASENNLAIKK